MRWAMAFIWTNFKSFLSNDVVEIGSVAREEFYRRRDRRTHETDFVFLSTLISGTLFLAFNMPKLLDKQLHWCDSSIHHYLEFRKLSWNHLICLWKCIFILSIKCVSWIQFQLTWSEKSDDFFWSLWSVICLMFICLHLTHFPLLQKNFVHHANFDRT